ncbi:MAG: phosphate signaling complex protein PhoU [Bacteroidetes bacterium]|nr:phosphate signaling complex protein PhoU [Bacteroidota bacterium]
MTDHILKRFDDELEKLGSRIGKMAVLVQQQVTDAIDALQRGDMALALQVIEGDDKVDLYDTKIEKHCMRLLALQQPVAIDLRTVLSALSVNRNLERMGDAAVNIAERIPLLEPHTELVTRTHIGVMGEVATAMIKDALTAFTEADVAVARSVVVRDNIIDEQDLQNFDILTDIMREHPELVEAASHLLMISRNLERLADEATNIAEEAVFVADAKIVKHRGWGRPDRNEDGNPTAPTADGDNGS